MFDNRRHVLDNHYKHIANNYSTELMLSTESRPLVSPLLLLLLRLIWLTRPSRSINASSLWCVTKLVFTARRYANAVHAMALCQSVSVSV